MSDLERSRYANESKRTRMNWKTLPFFGRPRQLYPMRCYFVFSQFSPENANRLPTDAFFFIRGLFVCTSFCPFLLRKLLSMLRTWNGHHRTKVSALSPTRRDWLARHCILQWLPTRMTHFGKSTNFTKTPTCKSMKNCNQSYDLNFTNKPWHKFRSITVTVIFCQ